MQILITAGPTHEPIDPVRFIGNRSSGKMGLALATAARDAGHEVTLILGPVSVDIPPGIRRIDVMSSKEMHDAVLLQFPDHDLLIMAAAVADFRPRHVRTEKIHRAGNLTIDLEPTEDIVAAASSMKRPNQRTVGFSLVSRGDTARSREKLLRKKLDLIVYNPTDTLSSDSIESILLYPDGRSEQLSSRSKRLFADNLIQRATALFNNK
ncbi:MAG TPA: phosphopantothenoylcysteine decarboxylase [Tepidisphaeraceae bacterium]|jgi:phosphopantothenoylcysteine decarboxylase/phosphopantothenate--cysteine ligase